MADVTQPPLDPTTTRLLQEHRQIRQAMTRLAEAPDLPELLVRLAEFRALMLPHFQAESAAGGFFDVLRGRAAGHFGDVAALEREHGALLEAMEQLERAARACLAGPVAAVLQQAAALAGRLQRHEERENELFLDSMYTDIGDQ